jgi:hypothetical protein
VFAAVGVHLHVAGLEDTPAVDGIEALPEELGGQTDLADLVDLLFGTGQVFLELVGLLAQLRPLPHPPSPLLRSQRLLLDLLGLQPRGHLHLLLLDRQLDLLDVVQLLPELPSLLPLPGCDLRLPLLLVAVADSHLGQLGLRLYLPGVGLVALVVDDPLDELLVVALPRVVGMAGFRRNDGWDGGWLVPVPALVLGFPDIVDGVEVELAGGLVAENLLGEDGVLGLEAIGIEGRPGAIIIIGDHEVLLKLSPDFLIVGLGLGLQQLRDIDVFSPLLLVLLTLQTLYFDQVAHFNFTKLRLPNYLTITAIRQTVSHPRSWTTNIIGKRMKGGLKWMNEKG